MWNQEMASLSDRSIEEAFYKKPVWEMPHVTWEDMCLYLEVSSSICAAAPTNSSPLPLDLAGIYWQKTSRHITKSARPNPNILHSCHLKERPREAKNLYEAAREFVLYVESLWDGNLIYFFWQASRVAPATFYCACCCTFLPTHNSQRPILQTKALSNPPPPALIFCNFAGLEASRNTGVKMLSEFEPAPTRSLVDQSSQASGSLPTPSLYVTL